MINVDVSTTIYRPVGQVFDFMSAPENDFLWQYDTLSSTRLSAGPSHSGALFRSIGHLMGQRFEITVRIPTASLRWSTLSIAGVTEMSSSLTWACLVDDPFTLDTTLPAW